MAALPSVMGCVLADMADPLFASHFSLCLKNTHVHIFLYTTFHISDHAFEQIGVSGKEALARSRELAALPCLLFPDVSHLHGVGSPLPRLLELIRPTSRVRSRSLVCCVRGPHNTGF